MEESKEKDTKISNITEFFHKIHGKYLLGLDKSKDLDSIGYYLTEHLRMGGGYWTLFAIECNIIK